MDMISSLPQLKPHLRPFTALSDFEVVQRVLDGDQPLYELLMRRYNRRLFLATRSIVCDDSLAQDVMQDSYLIAFKRLAQFRGPKGFGAWLLRIGSREALKTLHRHSKLCLVAEVSQFTGESTASDIDGPEETQLATETARLLERELDRLPLEYRTIFVLRELDELSTAETAAALQITPGTVKSRLHRAKALLQLRLGRRLAPPRSQVFPFAGSRCDGIVAVVFARLGRLSG